ncbi:integumentary mucin C.1-like [Haliotis rubra]|uniref:integumentary mucin C.1-like n=1 Tax=Haliotis rubra TaxID=36100 RepID=UPI001EE536FF|nr:integumentary mucin C.1-like [Haliotis rubra]
MNTLFPFLVVLAMLWSAELHTVETAVQCKSGKKLRQDCRSSMMKYRVTVIKELWWCRRGNTNCGYRAALDLDGLRRDIADKKSCCNRFSWFHNFEICILESIENLEICRNGSTTTTTTTSTTTTTPTTSSTTTTTSTTTISPTTSATTTSTSTTSTTPTTSATTITTSTTPTTSATTTATSTTTTSPTTSSTTTTTSTTTTSPTTSATTTTTSAPTSATTTTTSTTTTTTSSTTTLATLPMCRLAGGTCLFPTPEACSALAGRVDSGLFCPGSSPCCIL